MADQSACLRTGRPPTPSRSLSAIRVRPDSRTKPDRWPDMSGGGGVSGCLHGLSVQTRGDGLQDKPGSRQLSASHAADMVCKSLARASRSEAARGNGKEPPMPSILCVRNRMGRSVIEAVLADFDRNGPDAVQTLRETDPAGYAKTLSDLLAVRDLLRAEVGDRTKDKGRTRPRPAHPDGAQAPGSPGAGLRCSWAGRHRHACGPRSRRPGHGC